MIAWIEGFTQAMVGWRKFLVAMTTIGGAIYLCAVGQLEGSGFVTAALGVLALFGGANVAAKYATTVVEGQERS